MGPPIPAASMGGPRGLTQSDGDSRGKAADGRDGPACARGAMGGPRMRANLGYRRARADRPRPMRMGMAQTEGSLVAWLTATSPI